MRTSKNRNATLVWNASKKEIDSCKKRDRKIASISLHFLSWNMSKSMKNEIGMNLGTKCPPPLVCRIGSTKTWQKPSMPLAQVPQKACFFDKPVIQGMTQVRANHDLRQCGAGQVSAWIIRLINLTNLESDDKARLEMPQEDCIEDCLLNPYDEVGWCLHGSKIDHFFGEDQSSYQAPCCTKQKTLQSLPIHCRLKFHALLLMLLGDFPHKRLCSYHPLSFWIEVQDTNIVLECHDSHYMGSPEACLHLATVKAPRMPWNFWETSCTLWQFPGALAPNGTNRISPSLKCRASGSPIQKQKKSRTRMLTVGKGKGCASDVWAACKDAAHGHLQTPAFLSLNIALLNLMVR